jgi:hypothetical protein
MLLPGSGLLAGFLAGHGTEAPIDVFVLAAVIVTTYAGLAVLEFWPEIASRTGRPHRRPKTSPQP